jgi:hypothetical protein
MPRSKEFGMAITLRTPHHKVYIEGDALDVGEMFQIWKQAMSGLGVAMEEFVLDVKED